MKHLPFYLRIGSSVLILLLSAVSVKAVDLSLPVGFPAVRGTIAEISIATTNVTGLGVYAYDLQIQYRYDLMTFVDAVESGTLSSAWTANEYHAVYGNVVSITAAGTTPLAGSGTLLLLRFQFIGSDIGDLNWVPSATHLNEGTPNVTLTNGSVSISEPPAIRVTPNTAELLAGDSLLVTASGGTSPYTFAVADPSLGSFRQTTVNAGYFRSRLPGTTTLCATDNNLISGTSGSYVMRSFKLTIPDSTILSGRTFWMPILLRIPPDITPSTPQNLVAARAADGSQIHPQLLWSQQSGSAYTLYRSTALPFSPHGSGVLAIPVVTDELPLDSARFQHTDSSVDLSGSPRIFYAVTATTNSAPPVYSGQFSIAWNSAVVNLLGIEPAGTLLQDRMVQFEQQPGSAHFSFSSAEPMLTGGTLLLLQYDVVPGSGASTSLTLSDALFNEDQTIIVDHGSIVRAASPSISISPSIERETVAGDSLQYSVSGGTAPYNWQVTNPATGTVTATGRFLANAGGLTYVWVRDANGFTDSSALITVDDFRLVAQSLTAQRGDSATISVQLTGSATGLAVYAIEIGVSVSGSGWTFAYPQQSGTLLAGWASAFEPEAATLHLAASSSAPLAGAGEFLRLRGYLTPSAPVGSRNITLDFVSLNEGNRRAYRVNGILTIQ